MRWNVVPALIGTSSCVIAKSTVDVGLAGSLFGNGPAEPVPTWVPLASSSVKLQVMSLPPNGASTCSSSGSERMCSFSLMVPVIGDNTAAPSMVACSCHETAVLGQVEARVSREIVSVAG